MFEKNNNLYIVISISCAIALFALALDLDYFSGNILGIIGTIIFSILIILCSLYIVNKIIEPLELTQKAAILIIAIFGAFLLYTLAVIFNYYPKDLIAKLVAYGVWICISLPFSYYLIKSISPLRKTSSEEILIILIIVFIGLILILTLTLNNMIMTFIIAGTCILVYLFWLIALSKTKPRSKRVID